MCRRGRLQNEGRYVFHGNIEIPARGSGLKRARTRTPAMPTIPVVAADREKFAQRPNHSVAQWV